MKHNLLSFDGGGVRGLIPAVIITKIEKRLGQPLCTALDKNTDYLAGTSTGSIVACAIASGRSGEDIQRIMMERARDIFPSVYSRLWNRLGRSIFQLEGPSAPKYSDKGLQTVLQETFSKNGKAMKFGDLRIPTLITSYDTLNRCPVILKSWKSTHANLNLWEVIKASCSAPTYFPAHIMSINGAEYPLIDGGIVANNPSACLISSVLKEIGHNASANNGLDTSKIQLSSFGTGQVTRPITAKEAQEWGLAEWALPIIDVMFDGASDATHYFCEQLLNTDQYTRFQMPLTEAYDDLDNADKVNLNALKVMTANYLSANNAAVSTVASAIQSA